MGRERRGCPVNQVLIELQHEEIPAGMIRPALKSLVDGVVVLLAGIDRGEIRAYATPRRLAVVVDGVAEGRPRTTKLVMGPPVSSAFKDGALTKAGEGFARGKGVDPSAIQQVDGPKGRVIAVEVSEGGESTRDVLSAGLPGVIAGIPFKKSMEWGNGGFRFARPLHRVVAVFGGAVVPGSVGGVAFGNRTVGHRLKPGEFVVTGEADWLAGLRERWVEPDLRVREARIRDLLAEATDTLRSDPIGDDVLLEEVLHLVEAPTLVIGAFDEDLLGLPPRLLIKAMKAHQRYFPVFVKGRLTHRFVVISNNPQGDTAAIAVGNANVLRARFHDAKFFFAEDQKKRLEVHGAQLTKMRWIQGLGTMAQKQERVSGLAGLLAELFGADADCARRAGALCKSDLTTQMVGEFPDLQGHMGKLYALAQGEETRVAAAIEEHYQPVGAGAATAPSAEGAVLAVADRLDTLVGCFGIGLVPTGSGDPQGLRRCVLGVLNTLEARGVRVPLDALFRQAIEHFHSNAGGFEAWEKAHGADLDASSELHGALLDFAKARFKANASADGASGDLVDAVLGAVRTPDVVDWSARLRGLRSVAKSADFLPIMHTFKRVLNITAGSDAAPPQASQLTEVAERELDVAASRVATEVWELVDRLDYDAAFASALSLAGPVSRFFDAVLVEAPDPAVRAVRLGLLRRVSEIFLRLADFSRISTR